MSSNKFVFNIDPQPKPRMVKSDAWKKRPCVLRYWAYKDELNLIANRIGFEMPETMAIKFVLPMPKSWSEKKKCKMVGEPHKQTPDLDNLCKAFWDCLADQDKHLWYVVLTKYWDYEGKIIVTKI